MKGQKLINTKNKIKRGFKDSHTNVAHIQTRFIKVILTKKKKKKKRLFCMDFSSKSTNQGTHESSSLEQDRKFVGSHLQLKDCENLKKQNFR